MFKHLFQPPLKVKVKIRDRLYDISNKKWYNKGLLTHVILYQEGDDKIEYRHYHDSKNPLFCVWCDHDFNIITEQEAFDLIEYLSKY